MIVAAFDIVADTVEHLYDWLTHIVIGGVSIWSIFVGAFAAGLLFKVVHSMIFKEEGD